MDSAGQWRARDNVWIAYLDRRGPLSVGLGAREDTIGPELGFGWVLGDALDEPVLLIKCAWGGKSLAIDFRPPSAGQPPYSLGKETDAAIAQDPAILGKYYRETLELTKAALANLKDLVPGSDGHYVLGGCGWHQGWNDRINDKFNAEYESNLAHFIQDLRQDLGAPALPFVIAETGMSGPEEKHPRALSLMRAQAAVAEHEAFKGNVAFVGTEAFWRPPDQSPSGQAYHWNSRTINLKPMPKTILDPCRFAAWLLLALMLAWPPRLPAAEPAEVRNVILVLSDDHRYDFMGFHAGAPAWLETLAMDSLAAEGAHLTHAFVTTSLCSPVRASILTGQYMHRHGIVDNQRPEPPGTVFFPQHLQRAGIATALVGKWHMGHDDDRPRAGFDHWVSFPGQGEYFDPVLNINGQHHPFEGYDADVLTTEALRWLSEDRPQDRPFYLQLAFKAPHYPFEPAARHKGRYAGQPIPYPDTMARTERNYRTQPRWVRERRYSIHGIDHMETGRYDHDPVPSYEAWYYSYCEAIHSIDENLGRVIRYLKEQNLAERTLLSRDYSSINRSICCPT